MFSIEDDPCGILMLYNVRIYVYVLNGHVDWRTAVNERTPEPSATGSDRYTLETISIDDD